MRPTKTILTKKLGFRNNRVFADSLFRLILTETIDTKLHLKLKRDLVFCKIQQIPSGRVYVSGLNLSRDYFLPAVPIVR